VPFAPSCNRRASSRGQSLVELALIAPVFLLLLLTAIDLGRLLYSQITITNAAKEAALVASQGGTWQANAGCSDTNTVMCGALTEAQGGFVIVEQTRVTLSPATCELNGTYPAGGPPTVSVEVSSPFRVVTPIIGSFLGSDVILHATAQAECLVVPEVTFPSLPSPTAAFTVSDTTPDVGDTVSFDASGSLSPGATISSYNWSFGGSNVIETQTYASAGTYNVVLTVTDSRGQSATSSATITVTGGGGPGPTPTPTCPTVSFTVTPKNPPSQHKVDLDGAMSDGSGGWTWVWSGAITDSGQHLSNIRFPNSGTYSVTLTATKGVCAPTVTQTVTAP
jgi:Flp pilus assembly protein TadG/chitodextrinase